MEQERNSPWGARIERGRITAKAEGTYDIESYDRPGIQGSGIPAATECEAGDIAYFFLFPDGKGMIIGKA